VIQFWNDASCTINGGTYIASSGADDGGTATIISLGNLVINGATINANSFNNRVIGVQIGSTGTSVISNSSISAYSTYNYCEDSNDGYYCSSSNGVVNVGVLTVNNTYVMGTHAGLQNKGSLYINGGVYEGFGHGGIYFSGAGTTSYVENATIRECDMPAGYTNTANDNNAGMYIGGSEGMDNISVYMNNCDIYGSAKPLVLRSTSGEKNNSLYISYSRINEGINIRIDDNSHKLYSGIGNNFRSENTTLPSAVIDTNEVYVRE